ncbi:hypothetical protein PR048_012540 [Dryococelus australis]|uniref:Uncharacterized protein n=1 Tax=Dryococelus australis TaxID=614101 RepID=A0ABQ9HQD6_9NEOP|nr:hypothetical protein PR048_012540 [Dryococelus australis]
MEPAAGEQKANPRQYTGQCVSPTGRLKPLTKPETGSVIELKNTDVQQPLIQPYTPVYDVTSQRNVGTRFANQLMVMYSPAKPIATCSYQPGAFLIKIMADSPILAGAEIVDRLLVYHPAESLPDFRIKINTVLVAIYLMWAYPFYDCLREVLGTGFVSDWLPHAAKRLPIGWPASQYEGHQALISEWRFNLLLSTDVILLEFALGPWWSSGSTTRLSRWRTRFYSWRRNSRILTCGNRVGRCHWSEYSRGYLPFPPLLHSSAAPYSPRFTPISSQQLGILDSGIKISAHKSRIEEGIIARPLLKTISTIAWIYLGQPMQTEIRMT